MKKDTFSTIKKDTLEKLDKSPKGNIDEKIKELCNIINKREDMFTLSTCSGRICLLEKDKGKSDATWAYVTHNYVNISKIYEILEKHNKTNFIEFRQESVIMHIAVRDIDTAKHLMHTAKLCGFNIVGIIGLSKKITVEIICDAQIIVPAYDNKLLINKEYLEYLCNKADKNQEISWNCIAKLQKILAE